ncbi:unnamed protein product [Cunninghamella blakesleeana]
MTLNVDNNIAFSKDILTDAFMKLDIEDTELSQRITENFINKTDNLICLEYNEEELLRIFVEKSIPWPVISRLHGRSEAAIKTRYSNVKKREPPIYKDRPIKAPVYKSDIKMKKEKVEVKEEKEEKTQDLDVEEKLQQLVDRLQLLIIKVKYKDDQDSWTEDDKSLLKELSGMDNPYQQISKRLAENKNKD